MRNSYTISEKNLNIEKVKTNFITLRNHLLIVDYQKESDT